MRGQINLDDEAGLHIKNICKREDVNTIVEIGTWNGMGSTFCVYESIKNTEKTLTSLETWKEMYHFSFDFSKTPFPVSGGWSFGRLKEIDPLVGSMVCRPIDWWENLLPSPEGPAL